MKKNTPVRRPRSLYALLEDCRGTIAEYVLIVGLVGVAGVLVFAEYGDDLKAAMKTNVAKITVN